MEINMENLTEKLVELLEIPSPTGYTEEATLWIEEEFKNLGISTAYTNKKALIATIPGENDEDHITLSAHVDTLGAMVKEIKSNGRVSLSQLGGYAWATIEGEYCTIKTVDGKEYTGTILTDVASSHVHGSKTSTTTRTEENIEIRIDENVETAEDVRDLGIEVGDFVFLDPRVAVTESGYIKSRHLDDKAGVIALLGVAKYLTEENITPKHTINFFISNYEEVGHGSAAGIPKKTREFFAVDMAAPGEGQTSCERKVTIAAKDSSGPYDFEMRKKLIDICKDQSIDYAVDIYPYYGSDASAALRAGHDIRAALIGPGVDASHSFERTHKLAIENTIKLLINYII